MANGLSRQGCTYLSGAGPQTGARGHFRHLLHALGDGSTEFAACANPYDLVARFPAETAALERWFEMKGSAGSPQDTRDRVATSEAAPP